MVETALKIKEKEKLLFERARRLRAKLRDDFYAIYLDFEKRMLFLDCSFCVEMFGVEVNSNSRKIYCNKFCLLLFFNY